MFGKIRLGVFLVLAILVSGCAADGAKGGKYASERVALIIGNSAYRHTTPLRNPRNDARDLGHALRGLGFDVVLGIDLDGPGMQRSLREFSKKLPKAKVGMFYYAGHGIQVSGKNFMVPVDAVFDDAIIREADKLERETLMLGNVLQAMSQGSRINMVFLDACRDNPLVASIQGSGKGQKGRGIDVTRKGVKVGKALVLKGLAQVKASKSRNMFIAYATQPGNIALDGKNKNSPFTAAMLHHLATPGLEVSQLLTQVRKTVMRQTADQQIPWDHASLTEPFFFVPKFQQQAPPP